MRTLDHRVRATHHDHSARSNECEHVRTRTWIAIGVRRGIGLGAIYPLTIALVLSVITRSLEELPLLLVVCPLVGAIFGFFAGLTIGIWCALADPIVRLVYKPVDPNELATASILFIAGVLSIWLFTLGRPGIAWAFLGVIGPAAVGIGSLANRPIGESPVGDRW